MPHLAADRVLEDELVVVPEEIGADQLVRRVRKQLRDDADAVGEGVGDDRVRELDALQGRILLELHFLPLFAKLGEAEAAGVEKRLLVELEVVPEALHHERGAVLLERHADRRINGASLGLAALSEDATVGKIHPFPLFREELRRGTKRFVEFLSQFVHNGLILYQKTDLLSTFR